MTRSLELRVCIAHKSIPARAGQGMKYCCRMALRAEAQHHRGMQIVDKVRFVYAGCGVNALSGLQNRANSIHCRIFVGQISGAHQAVLPLPSVLYGF
ncbi:MULTISPECIES: hypothetical protein [unclassified Escherichia]|uniref:hypothetical protein n=1 Tax=unclassified Escherichia TaxID=2608889 RepID=UPI0014368DCF|nr:MULTISPECIES: hypothetical protein [unclassified Escherichia]